MIRPVLARLCRPRFPGRCLVRGRAQGGRVAFGPLGLAVLLAFALGGGLVVAGCRLAGAAPATSPAGSTPAAPSAPPPTVVLISLDGTRPADASEARMPALAALARRGLRAEAMIPVAPSNTFPSHVSLVTGVQPEVHGIVDNNFVDPVRGPFDRNAVHAFIESEPIWSIAERSQLPTASFYWVGSEDPGRAARARARRAGSPRAPSSGRRSTRSCAGSPSPIRRSGPV